MKTFSPLKWVVAWLGLAILLAPVGIGFASVRSQSSVEDQVQQALEAAAYDVSEVRMDGQKIHLTYRQSALQDQSTLPYAYLDVMMTVAEIVPEAETIHMEVVYLGEPFFEMSADGPRVQSLLADEMTLPEFLETIRFGERRELDTVLRQEFSTRRYPYDGYSLHESSLNIPVRAAELSTAEMIEATIELAGLAVVNMPALEEVSLSFINPVGQEIILTVPAEQAALYAEGEQSFLEAMAALELTGEVASRNRSSRLGRFLGVLELGLAAMAAAFYGISAARFRSWSLAIKAGLLVVMPAFLAGVVMLILMR